MQNWDIQTKNKIGKLRNLLLLRMEARPRVGEWEQKWGERGEETAERLNLDTFLNLIRESHSGILV